ncbi:MAG: multicopper oxidase domain-containing protein [Candidatus Zixiibacteriota bacterium]|nr:MAG: multicopper oxidase domain-containing protein [candidate division Zixibacteria bacterium]
MNSHEIILRMKATFLIAACVLLVLAGSILGQVPLDPLTLTKFIDPLPVPGVMPQAAPNYYEIGMYQVTQQLHSQLPPTTVWGYGTSAATASFPAATIEATRGVPIQVLWTNNLPMTHLFETSLDRTLHWADPQGPGIPVVTHLHGGENEPQSDGHPDAWFTQGFAETGPGWQQQVYTYYNNQEPTTLWYHDHALGMTRLNVYAGLAGFYLLRDPAVEGPMNLPGGPYEIPLVIQDRMFNTDGSLAYPTVGVNPEHPQWQPEFFGNTILVNGVVWPYLDVEPRKYRFRFLNGSNSRFYSMQLVDKTTDSPGPAFYQIGSDGGYLGAPVMLNDPADPNTPRLLMAPGERADIIIDFSGVAPGTEFVLDNNARSPFPKGATPSPQTERPIMKFRVVLPLAGADNSSITANNVIPALGPASVTRTFTLNEIMGAGGPLEALINGQKWGGTLYELPQLGATEIWEFVNLTGDAHPIHLHLVQFQLVSRQKFRVNQYTKAYDAANPVLPTDNPVAVSPAPYVSGKPKGPNPNESGWKDTFIMYPGEVSRVVVRFAPQDGGPSFPFDATAEPGYVYHCHILEHEDNEMMRPFKVVAPAAAAAKPGDVPETFGLRQNYPNPFNPTTDIAFALSRPGHVTLNVYNIVGQKVATLADGNYSAGEHTVSWDASAMSSGVYFYRLESAEVRETRKMLLLK